MDELLLSEDEVELSDELLLEDVDELSFELLPVGVELIPLLSQAVVINTAAHTRIVIIFFFIIISFHLCFLVFIGVYTLYAQYKRFGMICQVLF